MSEATINAVAVWLARFDCNASRDSLSTVVDLVDGVAAFDALAELAPEYFDSQAASQLQRNCAKDAGSAQLANLRLLVACIERLLTESLGFRVDAASRLNLSACVRALDLNEWVELLRVVLLAAVVSPNKQEAINKILTLDEGAQGELMVLINTGMGMFKEDDALNSSTQIESQPEAATQSAMTPVAPADNAALRQLESERTDLQNKLDELVRENRELRAVKNRLTEEAESDRAASAQALTAAVADARLDEQQQRERDTQRLRKQLETAEQAAAELESANKKALAEAADAKEKADAALAEADATTRALRDELDLSRDKVKQWASMEQTLQRYKQKLDESVDQRKRAKEAEDARAEQAERALKAEEELAKVTNKLTALQKYKDQALASEQQLAEAAERSEADSAEIKRLRAAVEEARRASEESARRLEDAHAQIADLKNAGQESATAAASLAEAAATASASAQSHQHHEDTERIQRLEADVRRLTVDAAKVPALEDELDTHQRRLESAQTQLSTAQRTSADLRARISELEEQASHAASALTAAKAETSVAVAKAEAAATAAATAATAAAAAAVASTPAPSTPVSTVPTVALAEFTAANQRIASLEAELNELQTRLAKGSSEAAKFEQMANEQASMNAQLREECDQARSNSASLIAARDALAADVSRLQVELQQIKTQSGEQTQADADTNALRAQIEAYRAKFEKSERKVALLTKTINGAQTEVNANFEAMKKAFQQNSQARIAKVQATYEATITKLQEEAVTRQRELETLNRLRNEQKDASKREERLISSAFYSVGMELAVHWQRSRGMQTPHGWLNKQRAKQSGSNL